MAYRNWVEGDRFWGRERDLEVFISRIESGAHSLLTGQRRMGKTGLMKETSRRLRERYLPARYPGPVEKGDTLRLSKAHRVG
jgi:AAA+ ATPase superfamily predicted ATPase